MKIYEKKQCKGESNKHDEKNSSLRNVQVISFFTSKESQNYLVGFNPMELESQIYSLQHEKVESMGRL